MDTSKISCCMKHKTGEELCQDLHATWERVLHGVEVWESSTDYEQNELLITWLVGFNWVYEYENYVHVHENWTVHCMLPGWEQVLLCSS